MGFVLLDEVKEINSLSWMESLSTSQILMDKNKSLIIRNT